MCYTNEADFASMMNGMWLLQVVPVVMHPGDALFFTGHTAHYTPANITSTR